MGRYIVIRDTREKPGQGWYFPPSTTCEKTIRYKLDVGDYALKGFESLMAIERKGSVLEICANLNQERFCGPLNPNKQMKHQSEIVRLEAIQWSYVLLEFTLEDLINFPNIPSVSPMLRKKIRFKGPAILKKIQELEMQYHTRFIFCGDKAKEYASSLFKRLVNKIEKIKNTETDTDAS